MRLLLFLFLSPPPPPPFPPLFPTSFEIQGRTFLLIFCRSNCCPYSELWVTVCLHTAQPRCHVSRTFVVKQMKKLTKCQIKITCTSSENQNTKKTRFFHLPNDWSLHFGDCEASFEKFQCREIEIYYSRSNLFVSSFVHVTNKRAIKKFHSGFGWSQLALQLESYKVSSMAKNANVCSLFVTVTAPKERSVKFAK